jgi:DNA-binding MarR family transcriptional regulator
MKATPLAIACRMVLISEAIHSSFLAQRLTPRYTIFIIKNLNCQDIDCQGGRRMSPANHKRESERPDASERRRELIGRLYALGEVYSTEVALFHQAAALRYGLGITDMKTLSVLMQEGAMTAGRIAQRLSLTTGAVTSLIDRLERRGLVTRAPDPNDRRKVIVIVNQQALNESDNTYLAIGQAFNALYASYTTEQLVFLEGFFQAAIELTRGEIARLASREP